MESWVKYIQLIELTGTTVLLMVNVCISIALSSLPLIHTCTPTLMAANYHARCWPDQQGHLDMWTGGAGNLTCDQCTSHSTCWATALVKRAGAQECKRFSFTLSSVPDFTHCSSYIYILAWYMIVFYLCVFSFFVQVSSAILGFPLTELI